MWQADSGKKVGTNNISNFFFFQFLLYVAITDSMWVGHHLKAEARCLGVGNKRFK